MGDTYTRQSSYTDGDVITAAHTNNEFNQLLAAFAASTGHTHDGTAAEGGPITKLLGNTLTFGAGTAGTDITITFDGETSDGELKWMEDEDYFEFSDDILIASTEKLQFRDTAIYINSSTDGQLDLVADTEIQIAATTIDINGNVDISGTLTIGSADISETELEILDGATVTTTELNILDGDTTASSTTVADADRVVFNDAGTMKQVAVTDLAAYFDDEITAMPNLTSVGTLTTLTVDNVIINGSTIGHTGDTDLMTVASGVLTVAGEVDATSLDISGDADIDGTLEADAITVNGTALNTVIAGVTVTDATNSAHVLVTDNESTNEENLITFVEDATSSTGNVGLEMDGNLTYNPSTGTITSTIFKGNIDAVDGDFDGTLEADAITLDGTAITATATLDTGISNNNVPKFTSGVADNDFLRVDGTAIEGRSASEVLSDISAAPAAGDSNIVTTGALNSGSITSGFGAINNGSSAITTTGTMTFGSLSDGSITVTAFVDEDDMSSDSATLIPTQQSVKAFVEANAGSFTSFFIEDDDGTEVTIDNAKELKFIGSGITTNFTDTSTGSDGDPFDLTFTVDAAQTGITSILATDLKIGEDDQTKIDFETADEIHFYAANAEQVFVSDGVFGPQTDSDVDLGTTGARFKDAYVDSVTSTGNIVAGGTASITGHASIGVDAINSARALTVAGATDGSSSSILVLYNSSLSSKLSVRDDGFVDIDGTMQITTAGNDVQLTLKSTDADANNGPILDLIRDSGSPADDDEIGFIRFKFDDDAGEVNTAAQIGCLLRDASNGSEDGQIDITTLMGGSSRSRLRMNEVETTFNQDAQSVDFRVESGENINAFFLEGSTGNIGIGHASPTLDAAIAGVSIPTGSRYFHMNDGEAAVIKLSDPAAGSNRGAQFALINTTAVLNNCESGHFIFGTGNAQVGEFDGSGTFLVGKTSDSFGTDGVALKSSGEVNMTRTNAVPLSIRRNGDEGNVIEFYEDANAEGSISVSTSGTTYNTTSDIRLKENIEPLKATDKLMQMNPVSYNWKSDPDGPRNVGFIAQEMQKIVPESVNISEDENKTMGMDYGRITPVLVSALQDAHKKIEELESRIAAMESK